MGKARDEKAHADSIVKFPHLRDNGKKQSYYRRYDEKTFFDDLQYDEKKQTHHVGGDRKKNLRRVGVEEIIPFEKGEDRGKKPRDSVSVLDRRVVLLYDKKKHFSCGRVPHQSTENWCCVGRTDFFIGKTHGEYRKSGKGSS